MGVENPNLSNLDKKYIKNNNFKDLCLSFGKGYSKKEGEQSSAKMALILHGALNNDQYDMSDIFYPDFDNFEDNNIENNNIENKNTLNNLKYQTMNYLMKQIANMKITSNKN